MEAAGAPPAEPVDMTPEEKTQGETFTQAIQKNIDAAVADKREGRIQSVTLMEEYIREQRKKKIQSGAPETEYSRVTDERRRPFEGGDRVMAPPPKEEAPEEETPSEKKDDA